MIKAKLRLYRLKWHLTLGVLVCLVLSNTILVLMGFKAEKITILVPTIDRKMSVGTRFVSEEYLHLRADQIVNMLFSMRPETSSYLTVELLKQCDSSLKSDFGKQIKILSSDIKTRGYYYVFNKTGYRIHNKNLTVLVSGDLETYLNDKRLKAVRKTYKLSFINKQGVVHLIDFQEVKHEKK